MNDDSQFLDNFKGSAVANVVSAAGFLIIYIIREKCKHSKCECDLKCFRCKCKDDDDSTRDEGSEERGEGSEERGKVDRQKTFRFPRQAQSEMQKLHVRVDKSLHAKYPSAIPSDGRGGCSVNTRVAEEKGNV